MHTMGSGHLCIYWAYGRLLPGGLAPQARPKWVQGPEAFVCMDCVFLSRNLQSYTVELHEELSTDQFGVP
jgi:hypothetical protein